MAYYVVSKKQIVSSVLAIASFLVACMWFMHVFVSVLDMPDVYKDQYGQCVKVINFKNGDKYTCDDVDVSLRKYNIIKQ